MKQFLDFILELVRIIKPDHRKWMVRIFVLAGIPLVSSSYIQAIVEAQIKRELQIDLAVTEIPGWILLAIGVVVYVFNNYQDRQLIKEPTFKEEHHNLNFSLGSGITIGYTKAQLQKGPNEPFNLGGHSPVKVYLEGNKLYADVEVYAASGMPPIKIVRNILSGLPHNWDSNKNENAIEIVDDKLNPVYQFIYKNDGHIIVNGIFPFPGGLVLADEVQGMIMNPNLPAILHLKRIFRYPTWKYPAEYET